MAGMPASQGLGNKFACPSDFVPLSPLSTSTTETINRPSTELWLIKAPLDFHPESFKGQKIPLIGFKSLKIKNDGKKRFYNIFSSPKEMETSHLIIPSPDNGQLLCGPPFQGYMNICDSYGKDDATGMLNPIPDCPRLHIPQNLKQRFQPFGAEAPSKTMTKMRKGETIQELVGVKTKQKKRRRKHEETGVEQKQECFQLAAFTEDGLQGNRSDKANYTEESLYLAIEDQQDTHTATKKRKKKKREREHAVISATALEMEDDLEVESSPVANKEAVVLEVAENIFNKTSPPHRKKKKRSLLHELLDERFAPTAADLSSVSHKKRESM